MLKVMIAEDDLLMADMLEEVLVEHGYEVCGIARTVDQAVELADRCHPDLAVLDLRLAEGGLGTDIVPRLHRAGDHRPGILYATGNGTQIGLTREDGEASLGKPYRSDDVVRALEIVEQIVSAKSPLSAFPPGFSLLNGAATGPTDTSPHSGYADSARVIERLRRQQAELASFGSFALGESDLGKVLTEAARICAESLGVPFAKICRYRADENDLLVEAGIGWNPGVIGGVVSRADKSSPQGRAFITGEPVICGELAADASFVLPKFYAEHGIVSTIDVIIKHAGAPYGVLEIDSPVQKDYDEHDVTFLTGFANVVAEAVDTSRRNSTLQAAVLRMQDMVADKDRLLEAKNALIEEKNTLAREVQHRVRNNLQLVHGMLSKQIKETADEAGREGIEAISRRVMTLAQVYDHLLGTGLRRTINFGQYLSSLCSGLESLQSSRPGISLACRWEPVSLDLDTVTSLGLVLSELISNSYKHAFPGRDGMINVFLTVDQAAHEATILYTDNGGGFVDVGHGKRHGLGLVRRLMEQVNGTATLVSAHGCEWTLRFPVPSLVMADQDAGMADTAT